MASNKVKIITKENFENTIRSEGLIIIDCWAPWCGPCRWFSPIIDQLSEEYSNIIFGKLNVDENVDIAGRFGIMSIPTTLFFLEGKLVDSIIGAVPKQVIEDKIHILK